MDKPFQSIGSLFVVIGCSIFLGLSSCESPGSVGSGLAGPKAEVETDTIFVEGIEAIQPNSYSGELSFLSAGNYTDPLFGSMEATAFLKPSLPGNTDAMDADANMLLRIMLDEDQIYGATSEPQEFSIYEIDELWRARSLRISDNIPINTNNKVGEFTVGTEDSLDVELSANWTQRYREYTTDMTDADSLYRYNFFGLAIVPDNENKIIPLNSSSTRFVIQNPEADTLDVSMMEWGYNLTRGANNAVPQGSAPLYSTYESVLNFNELKIADLDIQASLFSRAELVLYQNESVMEQSLQSEPISVERANESTIHLHLADSTEVPENIDPGAPLDDVLRIQGSYSADSGSYRFDITSLAERLIQAGSPEGREFFITLPNDGVIKPSLIYTDSDQVPANKQPKVIITYLKNSSK